mgnify:CR=1 FL=1|tara:strand:+ start:310 stop:999 length:690 start_codon:yes stop_codon:yes gene_type:complete
MMIDYSYTGAFLVGLMGAGHCLGMCGGIVGALSLALPVEQDVRFFQQTRWKMMLCYHLGRIGSYTCAGVVVASVTYMMAELIQLKALLLGLRILAGSMMILIGLYMARLWRGLQRIEVLGHFIWQKIQPMAAKKQTLHTRKQALFAGSLWGWLPCGLVYSTLTWSLATAQPLQGGLIMLCFGLGTLPGLLLVGGVLHHFKSVIHHRGVQILGALAMIAFGCHTLWVALM